MNQPRIGEIMYGGPDRKSPVKVVGVSGTMVAYVPVNVEVGYTHKGNLHDSQGDNPYRDSVGGKAKAEK